MVSLSRILGGSHENVHDHRADRGSHRDGATAASPPTARSAWGGGTPIGSVDVGTLMFADGALLAVHICLLMLPDQLEVFEQETVPTGSSLAVLPYAD